MRRIFGSKCKASKFILSFLLFLFVFENIVYMYTDVSRFRLDTANLSVIHIIGTAFLHANEYHLFRNSIVFLLLTPSVEYRIGSKRTLILFFISAIGGMVMYAVFGYLMGFSTSGRGASGASMFFVGLVLMSILYSKLNNETLTFFVVLSLLVLFEYWKIAFQVDIFSYGDTILVAHIGGFVVGYSVFLGYKKYHSITHSVINSKPDITPSKRFLYSVSSLLKN